MQNFIRHFIRIGPGRWTCVRDGEFEGPNGRFQVAIGTTFSEGTNYMGFDLAHCLEEEYVKKWNGHANPQASQSSQDSACDQIRPLSSRP